MQLGNGHTFGLIRKATNLSGIVIEILVEIGIAYTKGPEISGPFGFCQEERLRIGC
ncbi:hypothetical protein FGF1_01770 [Flavobacteriaceae bacterium GF1]